MTYARPRCRFCRSTAGTLIHVPAEAGYVGRRRGYRPIGRGAYDEHAECLAEAEAMHKASQERYAREQAELARELRAGRA